MAFINFFPGLAAGRLERMAAEQGRPKSKVLRDLIERAPDSDDSEWRTAHIVFYEIGRKLIRAAHDLDIAGIVRLAEAAKRAARKMDGAKAEITVRPLDLGKLHTAGKSCMKFRPNESETKLLTLINRSGLGKAACLRALIMGLELPDTVAARTWARASQAGGLIRHIAYALKHPGWEELEATGSEIRIIAGVHIRAWHERKKAARQLQGGQDGLDYSKED